MTAARSHPDPDRVRRVRALHRDWRLLGERYTALPPEGELLDKLERSLARRTQRIEHLRTLITEMEVEIAGLEREKDGFLIGFEALLTDLVDRARRLNGEGWSPTEVLGYRMWTAHDHALIGARERWADPHKAAVCLSKVAGDDLPHTRGECGSPPCGIYAVKTPHRLVAAGDYPPDVAIGLVGMSGKVVEHAAGYRAARARVVAVGMVLRSRLVVTADRRTVTEVFATPGEVASRLGRPVTPADRPLAETIAFLEAQERSRQWTSENKSA